MRQKRTKPGTSLVIQWLGLHVSTEGDMGSILGQETKISAKNKKQNKTKQKKPDKLKGKIDIPNYQNLRLQHPFVSN